MLKIYGHSDDCFEVVGEFHGHPDGEEYPCYEKPVMLEIYDFTFSCGVIVTGEYSPHDNGVWTISVEPIEEDTPMPQMSIEMAASGYSPMLVIECSENTEVTVK